MAIIRPFLERFLNPAEWLGEILFGLLMVLTFTLGAGMIVSEGREATRELLRNVLGCNLAWGLINALMFLMDRMFQRSRVAQLIEAVRGAPNEEQGLAIIRDELDPKLETVSSREERASLYRDIFRTVKNVAVPKTTIQREEIGGALVTFLLVFLTAVPAIVPFFFLGDLYVALRISNGLLLGLLFLVGYCWARETKANAWLTGLGVLLIGAAVVVVAKALGG